MESLLLDIRSRNSQFGAYRIPLEVLLYIFFLARDTSEVGEKGRTVWRISQVSHYWRSIAFFEYRLWKFIDFSNQGWTKEFIKRSQPARASASFHAFSLNDFDPIVEQVSQLESISLVRSDEADDSEWYPPMSPWTQAAPYLRSLSLKNIDICTNFLAHDAPVLQQLILTNCSVLAHDICFNFPSLVSLAIDNPKDFSVLRRVISMMQHMPLLEELKLIGVLFDDDEDFIPQHIHTPFPQLRSLYLSGITLLTAVQFLDHLALSPFVKIHLDCEECWLPLTMPMNALQACQGGSQWPLKTLQMSLAVHSVSFKLTKYVSEEDTSLTSSTDIGLEPFHGYELDISGLGQILSSFDLWRLARLDISSSGLIIPREIWTDINQFGLLPHLETLAVRGNYCKSFIKHFVQSVDQVSEALKSHKNINQVPYFRSLICFPSLRRLTLQRSQRQNKRTTSVARWPVPFPRVLLMLAVRRFVGCGLARLTVTGYELDKEEKELERLKDLVDYVRCYPPQQDLGIDAKEKHTEDVGDLNEC